MNFERKINIEIKVISLAVGVLAVLCSLNYTNLINP